MDARLVCRAWYEELARNENMTFKTKVPRTFFRNCGMKLLSLKFCAVNINELTGSMWEEVGCEIRSLELLCCVLGDQGLKNVILNCSNLQKLRFVLRMDDNDNADTFCSPEMLRDLNVIQRNLKSFEIHCYQKCDNITKWIKIFEVLFKIFPDVTHYSSGSRHWREDDETFPANYLEGFRFTFSKELGENNSNEIATVLALSMSRNKSHYREALNASSALRLVNRYYVHCCFICID